MVVERGTGMSRTGRLGCYIPKCMEEEIVKTIEEIGNKNRRARSEAMRVIVRRSQIGKDFEAVTKRMVSLPMFFQQAKEKRRSSG